MDFHTYIFFPIDRDPKERLELTERPSWFEPIPWMIHRHDISHEHGRQVWDRSEANQHYHRDVYERRIANQPAIHVFIVPKDGLEHQAAKDAIAELYRMKGWEPGTDRLRGIIKGEISVNAEGAENVPVVIALQTLLARYVYHRNLKRCYKIWKLRPGIIHSDRVARIKMGEAL